MISIRSVFRRLPSVTYSRGIYHVHGSTADGSKRKPVKFPAEHEPVIPDGTDMIVIIMGFFAAGRTIAEACHRQELVCRCLDASPAHRLTEADLQKLVEEGYRKPLARMFPQAEIILKKSL